MQTSAIVLPQRLTLVTIDVSQQLRDEAQPYIDKLTREHSGRHSFLEGDGIPMGLTGQLLYCKLRGAIWVESYHFDCLEYGEPVETKTCNAECTPRWFWWCKVAASNHNQRCQHIAFLRMNKVRTRAWFLGTIPKWQFDRDARFFEKDEPDPYPPYKPMPEACYAVEARALAHPEPRYVKI